MMINDMLIRQFFQNQCSEEEAISVVKYLEDHPEKLEEFFPQDLWDNVNDPYLMDLIKKQEILRMVRKRIGIKHRKNKLVFWISIAASILIVLTAGFWMTNQKKSRIIQAKSFILKEPAYTLVKINYGKEDMLLSTDDGSIIYLKPGSEIRYLEHLSKERRDFNLKGEARFKVAKDKHRPFNVYAAGTVTTALGTDFTIYSGEQEENMSITLHSGKIVVSPDENMRTNGMKKTYLLPGNRLLINKINFITTLIKIPAKPTVKKEIIQTENQTELTETRISFRNQSLDKIFDVLMNDFSTPVLFDKEQVKGMYFTGSFNRNEQTVQNILNEIALLNHLNIERKDSVYILTPKPEKPTNK